MNLKPRYFKSWISHLRLKNTTELRNNLDTFIVIKHYLTPLHVRKYHDVQIWCLSAEVHLGLWSTLYSDQFFNILLEIFDDSTQLQTHRLITKLANIYWWPMEWTVLFLSILDYKLCRNRQRNCSCHAQKKFRRQENVLLTWIVCSNTHHDIEMS